ncbi:tRNA-adenosine deaminase [Thalassoporum mexicanum PCC 7367]|uniref:nucleoside deaminase n=1 Tax=Thalassoporum mexicanum TaxID=3457544 RepID=UPI00029F8397|nr:nucleoside deaminase [Pseudanabaena sp. PCC 7367]AFY70775.1 tRNA-adenosine deaminase [Pseudanabaena sp. PCC 7367]
MKPEIDFALHQQWIDQAIALAKAAGQVGEIPVGAIVVDHHQQIIATGVNRRERDRNPIAHAEIVAIQAAAQNLKRWQLHDCSLYVTLEPCPMCAGAILQARIKRLVYGAIDPKAGAIHTVLNLPHSPATFHRLEAIAGIRAQACQQLLQDWFQAHRHASD